VELPGAATAIVDPAKVRDYLLSSDHPVGHAKARFFTALGFTQENWPQLRDALLRLAFEADAQPEPESPFGQKYVLRGIIQGPGPTAGRATVETVWIVLNGETVPRFVTAYPGDRP
jgi:hypothetical protein